MTSEEFIILFNAASFVIPISAFIIFIIIIVIVVRHNTPLSNDDNSRYVQLVRRAGESVGLTYWKGERGARYASSKLLSLPGVSIYYGLSSNDGIDIGLAEHTRTDRGSRASAFHDYMSVQLPHNSGMYLLIDSKHNNFLGLSVLNFVGTSMGLHEFVLEGDFPQNYKVYGEPGSQVETLQLLNPKAMQQLIESFTEYDFEIAGDSVYMYGKGGINLLTSPEKIKKCLDDGRKVRQFMQGHMPKI